MCKTTYSRNRTNHFFFVKKKSSTKVLDRQIKNFLKKSHQSLQSSSKAHPSPHCRVKAQSWPIIKRWQLNNSYSLFNYPFKLPHFQLRSYYRQRLAVEGCHGTYIKCVCVCVSLFNAGGVSRNYFWYPFHDINIVQAKKICRGNRTSHKIRKCDLYRLMLCTK